ncbi:thymidylate kinase [Anaerotignum neopropionicum]|uniref:Thymidylate kinase n=1 Tax=Anaerotignum neopropionicum TaxID=36847 RepID=A0A136WBA2_9FIRM|nr:dTMP kinase [Anaerotignum neopropionicum]KXL51807.1 thymidylate kinase [Anaerotignum neopropionicum]
MRGFFISVEGSDGSGKSTQIRKIEEYLKKKKQEVLLTREPGGTMISEKIRELLLDPSNKAMAAKTEMLLYAAARAQHVEEFVLPNLKQGKHVLTDRFTDSSIAYQGFGRAMGDMVAEVNRIATGGLSPDITFYLELSPEAGIGRKKAEVNHKMDRLELEKQEFHQKVYMGYKALCETQEQRICKIDASQDIETVFVEIQAGLDRLFGF